MQDWIGVGTPQESRELIEPDVFYREQQVQHALAIIQKTAHVSILQINEASIRAAVDRGRTPGEIARQWLRTRES
jgi:hypothetical protein